jgi:hypothetical protein
MLDLLAQSNNSRPYVQIGKIMVSLIRSLFLREAVSRSWPHEELIMIMEAVSFPNLNDIGPPIVKSYRLMLWALLIRHQTWRQYGSCRYRRKFTKLHCVTSQILVFVVAARKPETQRGRVSKTSTDPPSVYFFNYFISNGITLIL